MDIQDYEFHPYSSVLPMLGTAEANELAADIQANGLREDIVLFEGKILDGRNRYRACKTAGVEPRFVDLNGDSDPIDFIVSKNIKRRHLTQSQKATVVAKIANLPSGNPKLKSSKTPINPNSVLGTELGKTVAEVARDVGVSVSTVGQAKRVIRDAPKDVVAQVESGEKSVSTAVREMKAKKAKEEAVNEGRFDKTGYPIPESVVEDWNRAEAFRSTLNDLHKIKLIVEKALENRDLIYREIGKDSLIDLTNAWTTLKQILPYAVCPSCQGRKRKDCTACKQRGFVSEFGYKHWFAKEVIELRERAINK